LWSPAWYFVLLLLVPLVPCPGNHCKIECLEALSCVFFREFYSFRS
jgi:hypothetical protein